MHSVMAPFSLRFLAMSFAFKPGWLRIGLLTLAVLAVVLASWLGYQINIIEHRKSIRKKIEVSGGHVYRVDQAGAEIRGSIVAAYNRAPPYGAAFRRLIGDEHIVFIELPTSYDGKVLSEARHAFPREELKGTQTFS